MATISSGLTGAIVGLSDLFSKRAWPLVQILLAGAILAVGRAQSVRYCASWACRKSGNSRNTTVC